MTNIKIETKRREKLFNFAVFILKYKNVLMVLFFTQHLPSFEKDLYLKLYLALKFYVVLFF